MPRLNLEERTQQHPQLAGRAYPSLPAAVVEQELTRALFVGSGSFCRVFRVDKWTHTPSEACGLPVVVKLCSAGFNRGQTEEQRRSKQAYLTKHWYRETNAHLVLQGQARVVRVYHTFQGKMMVPPIEADAVQGPLLLEVVGLVEELCNQTSLSNFLWRMHGAQKQQLRALWTLGHLASEFAALMAQVGRMDELGICHQDINLSNVMVHLPASRGRPVLKFGDLNGAQWQELTRHGHCWIGTPNFMPRRVQRLYLGLQKAAPGVGELSYDTYQMGKTLLRVLLDHSGTHVPYSPGTPTEADLAVESAEVKGGAVAILATPQPAADPDRELWVFGVLIGLLMCWDEDYTSSEDQLRLAPAAAAEALGSWAALCSAWETQDSASRATFWADPAHQSSMADLYLRLAELARLPPLEDPIDPEVHTQTDQHIMEVVENFFLYGCSPTRRLAPVRQRVEEILAERQAAEQAKAATAAATSARTAAAAVEAAAAAAVREAEQRRAWQERPGSRRCATAWESKLAARAGAERAFLEGSSSDGSPARLQHLPTKPKLLAKKQGKKRQQQRQQQWGSENVASERGQKRKAGAAAAAGAGGGAGLKKPKVRAGAGGVAGGSQGPSSSGGDLLALGAKLRLKDIFGEQGAKAARAAGGDAEPRPLLLGPNHAVAVMLADTVRAAIAAAAAAHGSGGGGGSELHLQLGAGCVLRFRLAARQSVQFSRRDVLALAADGGACRVWNKFVEAALAAWQDGGREGSQAERLALLDPLLAQQAGGGGE